MGFKLTSAALTAAIFLAGRDAAAEDAAHARRHVMPASCNGSGWRQAACSSCAPKICRATATIEKEQRPCFQVEQKEVCVPEYTLPCWLDAFRLFKPRGCAACAKCPPVECCDPPRCGRVIVVNVLKTDSYECDECKYDWKIEDAPACHAVRCQHLPAVEEVPPPP